MSTNRLATLYKVFYWIGITMAVACFTLAFAGNSEVLLRLEHSSLPPVWVAAAGAILAFLAAECCHTDSSDLDDPRDFEYTEFEVYDESEYAGARTTEEARSY